jgi:hypothetical protein
MKKFILVIALVGVAISATAQDKIKKAKALE